MKEEKVIVNKECYGKVTPRIVYYVKSKNISRIFKEKCPLLAAGGYEKIINLFSNSLEHMGYFSGHKHWILCLCPISDIILASGSVDKTIKIWNLEDRSIISTLYGHTERVNVLCSVREGVFVSGSYGNSLTIWSKSTPESSTYSHRQVLTGHTSQIKGIIRINNREIVSGDGIGDLMFWNIDQGLCVRYIPCVSRFNHLYQMKQHIRGDILAGNWKNIKVWGHWGNTPIKQFNNICYGHSIEFLSRDLLLRGGYQGQLEFIDYTQTGCQLPPIIKCLHLKSINAIQRIAKNIVVTASTDGYLKVIHPISRKCYLKFKVSREALHALAYFY